MQGTQETVVKCKRCGAPIEYTPDSIFVVCSYCGYTNWFVDESKVQIFVVPSKPRDKILEAFWNRMKEDSDMGRIVQELEVVDTYGVYVPTFLSKVEVFSTWSGVEVRTVSSGKRTRIERIQKEGKFSDRLLLSIPARRTAEEFGLDELISKVSSLPPNYIKLEESNWSDIKLQVLNTEISQSEAIDEIKDKAEDITRQKIRSSNNLSEFNFYSCSTTITEVILLLVPLWVITYKYKNGIYNTAISGYDLVFLKTTEPVFFRQRILNLVGSLVAVLIGVSVISLWLRNIGSLSNSNSSLFFIVVGFLCFIVAYSLSSTAISDVRVERWH
jgi:hypothetical protein